jgi:hypothetical protein
MPIPASFGCCEEAALNMPGYFPCNRPAVAVLRWHRRTDPEIRVCSACLNHNVKNRGGEVVRYVEDWANDDAQN